MLPVLAASAPIQKEPVIFTRNVVSGLAPSNTAAPYRITEPEIPSQRHNQVGILADRGHSEHFDSRIPSDIAYGTVECSTTSASTMRFGVRRCYQGKKRKARTRHAR